MEISVMLNRSSIKTIDHKALRQFLEGL